MSRSHSGRRGGLSVGGEDLSSQARSVLRFAEVATTGDADYFLRVCCADLDAYNAFLEDFLFKLNGVANIKTQLVLRRIKQSTQLPL